MQLSSSLLSNTLGTILSGAIDITNSVLPLQVFSDSQETLGAAGISNMETLNLQAK